MYIYLHKRKLSKENTCNIPLSDRFNKGRTERICRLARFLHKWDSFVNIDRVCYPNGLIINVPLKPMLYISGFLCTYAYTHTCRKHYRFVYLFICLICRHGKAGIQSIHYFNFVVMKAMEHGYIYLFIYLNMYVFTFTCFIQKKNEFLWYRDRYFIKLNIIL